MTKADIEIAVAEYFNYLMNIIVPNVGYGLFKHFPSMEVDLLILRPSGYGDEVEIKTTASDIKRDARKKRHQPYWHDIKGQHIQLLRRRFFAVPEALAAHASIPADVGILSVDEKGHAIIMRAAPINKKARPLTADEQIKLMRLGCMRIWTLKKKLNKKPKEER